MEEERQTSTTKYWKRFSRGCVTSGFCWPSMQWPRLNCLCYTGPNISTQRHLLIGPHQENAGDREDQGRHGRSKKTWSTSASHGKMFRTWPRIEYFGRLLSTFIMFTASQTLTFWATLSLKLSNKLQCWMQPLKLKNVKCIIPSLSKLNCFTPIQESQWITDISERL